MQAQAAFPDHGDDDLLALVAEIRARHSDADLPVPAATTIATVLAHLQDEVPMEGPNRPSTSASGVPWNTSGTQYLRPSRAHSFKQHWSPGIGANTRRCLAASCICMHQRAHQQDGANPVVSLQVAAGARRIHPCAAGGSGNSGDAQRDDASCRRNVATRSGVRIGMT